MIILFPLPNLLRNKTLYPCLIEKGVGKYQIITTTVKKVADISEEVYLISGAIIACRL